MGRRLNALLIVVSLALIAVIAIWVLRDGGDGVTVTVGEPVVVDAGQLSAFAGESETPVYWLGEHDDDKYELTETAAGRVYVRYLEAGVEAGDALTTVAVYPSEDPVAALRRSARNRSGAKLGRTADGAVLLIDPTSPDNAHLAYPGEEFQVEVFSPAPGEALRLASRGAVQPVG